MAFLFPLFGWAQKVHDFKDSLVVSNRFATVIVNNATGRVSYRFSSGAYISNAIAYVEDLRLGFIPSPGFSRHVYHTSHVEDSLGKGVRITITHSMIRPGTSAGPDATTSAGPDATTNAGPDATTNAGPGAGQSLSLIQHITLYEDRPCLLLNVEATSVPETDFQWETRHISPIAILPSQNGHLFVPGDEPRILDVPFDNDNWVNVVERKWNDDQHRDASGISYEFTSVYDNQTMQGLVLGSVSHDFWKTGIAYHAGNGQGDVDSLNVFGGVATQDNPALPADYGGKDGTHDYMPHGTMRGITVHSPMVYLSASTDVREDAKGYGQANVLFNGSRIWKGAPPFYWNSFGVEGVLGYEKVMMPDGVRQTSDFIRTLDHFNSYSKPVLSIDSYDQSVYSTEVLAALSNYAAKQGQQLGFYFSPFSVWTWKNSVDQAMVPGTSYPLREVILRDNHHQPIPYKDGDWGCFPIDPTHPATRLGIIAQLQKAKAINARFLKIDFLTAGSLESSVRYDTTIRSGIQAYNFGMTMLRHLVDSIMGPDIFITQAISPMFPSQYAHARFVSTDVYSHLRNDQKGFPSWGSTEASLATGSHMGWVQGTLWPYTNLDITIMQHFQKNPDLSEQEIKVRIYALMVMGSILGDGSDYRQPLAVERARIFLNNPAVDAWFSHPRAFTPLKWADGDSMDQQMVFRLKGDTTFLCLFNFSKQAAFTDTLRTRDMGLSRSRYVIQDFLTGTVLGQVEKDQTSFILTVPKESALMVRLVRKAQQ